MAAGLRLFYNRALLVALAVGAALGLTALDVLAQSSTVGIRVERPGVSLSHYCQEGGRDATSVWGNVFSTFAECQHCLNTLCEHPSIGPRTIAPAKVQPAESEYYCGLANPSQWLTLRHASTSMRTYRQAASVNPYSAIALFSARTEASSATEPNRFSLSAGTLVLEKRFSKYDTIKGIEAELAGRPLDNLGAPLPPNSFITVISERAAEFDDPTTGDPGGFRITAYMENMDGNRTVLGDPALILVDVPRKVVAATGESIEIFSVKEVVSARPR